MWYTYLCVCVCIYACYAYYIYETGGNIEQKKSPERKSNVAGARNNEDEQQMVGEREREEWYLWRLRESEGSIKSLSLSRICQVCQLYNTGNKIKITCSVLIGNMRNCTSHPEPRFDCLLPSKSSKITFPPCQNRVHYYFVCYSICPTLFGSGGKRAVFEIKIIIIPCIVLSIR